MPLPVFHTFAGYSICKVIHKKKTVVRWPWIAASIFFANLPDLDYLTVICQQLGFIGCHRGISHSFGAAVIIGLAAGGCIWIWQKINRKRLELNTSSPASRSQNRAGSFPVLGYFAPFFLYLSHILLDFFTNTGVPLFWPLNSRRFAYPLGILFTDRIGGISCYLRPLCYELAVSFFLWAIFTALRDSKQKPQPVRSMALVRFMPAVIFIFGFIALSR